MSDSLEIKFLADDVRPRASNDGGWVISFECGEDAAQAVALLALLRKKGLEITVREV